MLQNEKTNSHNQGKNAFIIELAAIVFLLITAPFWLRILGALLPFVLGAILIGVIFFVIILVIN